MQAKHLSAPFSQMSLVMVQGFGLSCSDSALLCLFLGLLGWCMEGNWEGWTRFGVRHYQ